MPHENTFDKLRQEIEGTQRKIAIIGAPDETHPIIEALKRIQQDYNHLDFVAVHMPIGGFPVVEKSDHGRMKHGDLIVDLEGIPDFTRLTRNMESLKIAMIGVMGETDKIAKIALTPKAQANPFARQTEGSRKQRNSPHRGRNYKR